LPPLYDDLRTLGNARLASPLVRGVLCHLFSMHPGKGNTERFTRTTAAVCSGEPDPRRSHATRAICQRRSSGCVCIKMIAVYLNEKLALSYSLILIHMDMLPLGRPSPRRVCGQEAEGGP
jgi:hypothetical protein